MQYKATITFETPDDIGEGTRFRHAILKLVISKAVRDYLTSCEEERKRLLDSLFKLSDVEIEGVKEY